MFLGMKSTTFLVILAHAFRIVRKDGFKLLTSNRVFLFFYLGPNHGGERNIKSYLSDVLLQYLIASVHINLTLLSTFYTLQFFFDK